MVLIPLFVYCNYKRGNLVCRLYFPASREMIQVTGRLLKRSLNAYPVTPKRKLFSNGAVSKNYGRAFWRSALDPTYLRTSFWTSDFKHQHLVRTGGDYTGKVPQSPYPGTYRNQPDVSKLLGGHPRPQRESRHLPVMPTTPRFIYEKMCEHRIDWMKKMRLDRRRMEHVRNTEFHEWYGKLQRVRGRWCREQGHRKPRCVRPCS